MRHGAPVSGTRSSHAAMGGASEPADARPDRPGPRQPEKRRNRMGGPRCPGAGDAFPSSNY